MICAASATNGHACVKATSILAAKLDRTDWRTGQLWSIWSVNHYHTCQSTAFSRCGVALYGHCVKIWLTSISTYTHHLCGTFFRCRFSSCPTLHPSTFSPSVHCLLLCGFFCCHWMTNEVEHTTVSGFLQSFLDSVSAYFAVFSLSF